MADNQDLAQGIPGISDPTQSTDLNQNPSPNNQTDDDDGNPDDDEDVAPKPSSEPTILAKKDHDEHMQIVGKNDEHVASMTNDPDMLQHMQQMNTMFNQTSTSMGSGMSIGIGMTQSNPMNSMGMGMGMNGMPGMNGMGMSMENNGQPGMGMGVVVQGNLTSAGNNAAQGADVLVANTNEHWINGKWRPVMGWMYMCVCIFDFVIAPILWSIVQAVFHGAVNVQWQPLTLQGAGLFHIAMGAVLGVAAYGRTQEKIQGVNTASTATPPPASPVLASAPVPSTGLPNPSLPNGFNGIR